MKNDRAYTVALLALLGAFLTFTPLAAQAAEPKIDSVQFKKGVLNVLQDGVSAEATNEVTMPHDIKVSTNGTFRVNGGKERQLRDGQVLGADGMLASPDGTLKPVFDNIAVINGQPRLLRDGEVAPVQHNLVLADGSILTPDGFFVTKSGERRKLLDGETFELTGKPVASEDTIVLKEGKVWVQKDGNLLEVPPGRTIMMSDGTKVFGDGTVTAKDGARKTLVADEIVKIEGAAPRGR